MHTITIDGQNLVAHDITGQNLEEMLMCIMGHPLVENRVITTVLVNGESYSEEVPHAAVEVERTSIGSLELITKTAEDLSLHFLKHGHYLVNVLRSALPKIVDDFRLGDENEANEHFLSFLEALHLLVNMLDQSRQVIGFDGDLPIDGQKSLNGHLDDLAKSLTTMIHLQEQGDWIFLADLLEYELDGHLANILELLPVLNQAGH